MTTSWKREIALGVFVIVALIAAIVSFDLSTRDDLQTLLWPRKFSVSSWREHPDQRHRMADNLVQSGDLIGKNEAWVLRMLGEPDEKWADDTSADLRWFAPTPQRPDDELVVIIEDGVVTATCVLPDVPYVTG